MNFFKLKTVLLLCFLSFSVSAMYTDPSVSVMPTNEGDSIMLTLTDEEAEVTLQLLCDQSSVCEQVGASDAEPEIMLAWRRTVAEVLIFTTEVVVEVTPLIVEGVITGIEILKQKDEDHRKTEAPEVLFYRDFSIP